VSDLLCARIDSATAIPDISTGGTVDQLDAATPTGSRSGQGTSLADKVLVPAGRAALVRVSPGPNSTDSGAYYLITDLGIRYAVPSEAVATLLGYDPKQAVPVPSNLVIRIPSGPSLDPAAAVQPVKVTSGS
jgi:hypothetical protein